MPKEAKLAAAKVREICTQFANEFAITPRGDLYFSLCGFLVKSEKRFYFESHRKWQHHERDLKRKNTKQAKQVFIKTPSLQFNKKVISAILAADIPLHNRAGRFYVFLNFNYPRVKVVAKWFHTPTPKISGKLDVYSLAQLNLNFFNIFFFQKFSCR